MPCSDLSFADIWNLFNTLNPLGLRSLQVLSNILYKPACKSLLKWRKRSMTTDENYTFPWARKRENLIERFNS